MFIGEIQRHTSDPFWYLFGEAETDFPGIASSGGRIMDEINAHVKAQGILPTGPVIWMYDHIGNGRVKLKAGVPVPEGVPETGNLRSAFQPAWEHMAALFNGSMEDIGQAWDEFTEAVGKSGLAPMNINREVYRKWVAYDSKENVTELQVQVEA